MLATADDGYRKLVEAVQVADGRNLIKPEVQIGDIVLVQNEEWSSVRQDYWQREKPTIQVAVSMWSIEVAEPKISH